MHLDLLCVVVELDQREQVDLPDQPGYHRPLGDSRIEVSQRSAMAWLLIRSRLMSGAITEQIPSSRAAAAGLLLQLVEGEVPGFRDRWRVLVERMIHREGACWLLVQLLQVFSDGHLCAGQQGARRGHGERHVTEDTGHFVGFRLGNAGHPPAQVADAFLAFEDVHLRGTCPRAVQRSSRDVIRTWPPPEGRRSLTRLDVFGVVVNQEPALVRRLR